MLEERIELLRLPKQARGAVGDLVRALNAASTHSDLAREGEIQIEVIAGLEKARTVRAGDAEALYMIFDDAVHQRLSGLAE